jgi:hypothetical protein
VDAKHLHTPLTINSSQSSLLGVRVLNIVPLKGNAFPCDCFMLHYASNIQFDSAFRFAFSKLNEKRHLVCQMDSISNIHRIGMGRYLYLLFSVFDDFSKIKCFHKYISVINIIFFITANYAPFSICRYFGMTLYQESEPKSDIFAGTKTSLCGIKNNQISTNS